MNSTKLLRWPRLLLGVVTLLFAGIIYAWSILKAPLAATFGWDAPALAFNFTITMCFFCLGSLVSGLLAKKTSPKLRMAISAIFVFAGFFIVSQLSGNNLVALYLAYGVVAGTGIGIVYNTVISVTNAWFPDKKGVCSGSLMMGFGFSTLLLGKIAGLMIDAPDIGWRTTYLVLAISIGVVLLIAGLFIKLPPADAVFAPAGKPGKASSTANSVATDYTTVEMLKRASFWKLFIFFVLLSAVGSTAISFAKDYIVSVGGSASYAVTFVGILAVFNGLGRLCSGTVFDMLGLRRTQIITSIITITAPVIAFAAVLMGSLPLGVIGLCLCGFSYGFSPTVTAAFTAAFYGTKNFALNFSVLILSLIPASFTATLAGYMITSSGSYNSTFIMLAVFSLIGLVINLSIKRA